MIAALYVETDGPYFGLEGVDPWDITRDARTYPGPYPVVAHPPCQRWGRYWSGGPSAKLRRQLGDDDGCFASALASVRQWGGVLEHPEGSPSVRSFGLFCPPKGGGWIVADSVGGWTCCVEQGHYGHKARKATWLYVVGVSPPPLKWGRSAAKYRLDLGFHSKEERALYTNPKKLSAEQRAASRSYLEDYKRQTGKEYHCPERLTEKERIETPLEFRDLLLGIVRPLENLSKKERLITPLPFRDLLLEIAGSVHQ